MKEKLRFLQSLKKDWRLLMLSGLLSFGFVQLVSWWEQPIERSDQPIDTLIPAGFLLIPIEVQNYEALDALLGQFGVVDLFRGSGKEGHLVARNVRILRAPLNPSHFAVMAPENQANAILSSQGNFYVALKGPNQRGTQIVDQRSAPHRIHFDGD